MVTHDFSGAGISDQTQISRAAAQRKVSYISDPDLLRLKGGNLFRAGFQQIRMPVKSMMAVGGFVICPFHWHQEPVFAQQSKQTVPSDIQPFADLSVQQIVQFTCTDSWLTTPDPGNKIKDMSMLFLSFCASCIVLIPRLSAVPQKLACTRNGYFWGRTLREHLPGRFFTTLTP